MIGQALVAVCPTVDAYFLLGGDPAVPIIYDIDRICGGRSYIRRPRGLPLMRDPARAYFERERQSSSGRSMPPYLSSEPVLSVFNVWMRATARLRDDPAIHRCILAFASELTCLLSP